MERRRNSVKKRGGDPWEREKEREREREREREKKERERERVKKERERERAFEWAEMKWMGIMCCDLFVWTLDSVVEWLLTVSIEPAGRASGRTSGREVWAKWKNGIWFSLTAGGNISLRY
jgi:hypothetical protein